MPLITPRKNESQDEFIARFMSEMKKEFPDAKQRLAVAYKQWRAARGNATTELFDAGLSNIKFLRETASSDPAFMMFKDIIDSLAKDGIDIMDKRTRAPFIAEIVHSLPAANSKGRGFSYQTLARSYKTFSLSLADIEHELQIYEPDRTDDQICGLVIAAKMPELTDPQAYNKTSVPVYLLGSVWRKAKASQRILGISTEDALAAVRQMSVSMEVLRDRTTDAIWCDGAFFPVASCDEEMLACIGDYSMKSFRGKPTVLALGGEDGEVIFDGMGFTVNPADKQAGLVSIVASASAADRMNWIPLIVAEVASENIGMRVCPVCESLTIEKDCCENTIELSPAEAAAAKKKRGAFVVPRTHPKCKDHQDHFPINTEGRGRNALARVNQFSRAPKWWDGTLKELQMLIRRAVKRKYPHIEVTGLGEKGTAMTLEEIRQKVWSAIKADSRFSELIQEGGNHFHRYYLRDVIYEDDIWHVVIADYKTDTLLKLPFTIEDGDVMLSDETPVETKLEYSKGLSTLAFAGLRGFTKATNYNTTKEGIMPIAWWPSVKMAITSLREAAEKAESPEDRAKLKDLLALEKSVAEFDEAAFVESVIAERKANGELFTKEQLEQAVKDERTKIENEIKAKVEADQKVASRLAAAKAAGIKLEAPSGKKDKDGKPLTFEQRIRAFPLSPEGDDAFETMISAVTSPERASEIAADMAKGIVPFGRRESGQDDPKQATKPSVVAIEQGKEHLL